MWKFNRQQRKFLKKIFFNNRIFFMFVCLLLVLFLFILKNIWLKKKFLFQKISFVQNRINEVQSHSKYLKDRISNLENNLDYVEKIAREKLGMKKKEEIVYKIVD